MMCSSVLLLLKVVDYCLQVVGSMCKRSATTHAAPSAITAAAPTGCKLCIQTFCYHNCFC